MRLKTICLSLTALAALSAHPPMARADLAAVQSFSIPPQPLSTALIQFSKQADVQVVGSADTLQNLDSSGITGSFTGREALKKLLADQPLIFQEVTARSVRILPQKKSGSVTAIASGAENFELAQAGFPQSGNSGENSAQEGEPANSAIDASRGVPEILVTGKKTLNMDIQRTRDDALPYVTFDREQIEKSGASSIDEFLKYKLPMATQVGSNNQSSTLGNSSTVKLRGLESNQTLILIDGHRTSSVSFNGSAFQPDLNGISLSAIERIEILPTTASGMYGGSATGGVINVILRRNYSGIETRLRYDGTFSGGGSRRVAEFSAGFNLEEGRTNVLLTGSHSDSNPLLMGDRDFVQRYRRRLFAINPDATLNNYVPALGATTNICSAAFGYCTASGFAGPDVPLTLKDGTPLNSSITSVSPGYGGAATDDGRQFVTNAGQYNLALSNTAQSSGRATSLLSTPAVESFGTTLRREFSERVNGFLEVSASKNSSRFLQNGFGSFSVPASAPANPFAQDIVIMTPTFGADASNEWTLRSRRAVAGIIVKLPRGWQSEFDYTWNRSRVESSNPPLAMLPAVGNAIAGGAIDVFRDTNVSAVDFGPYVDPASRSVIAPAEVILNDATLRVSGPPGWTLPGGDVVVSGLLEYRKEKLGDSSSLSPPNFTYIYPSRWQAVQSVYLESRLPLISARNAKPGLQELELTVAARHDRYKTVGANTLFTIGDPEIRATNRLDSTDPTVSLTLQPVHGVQLRASYGTGFLPPGVEQITPRLSILDPTYLALLASFGYTDPHRGGEPIGGGGAVTIFGGGNPNLMPENSESWSVGTVLNPGFARGLRLSLDWIHIDKSNNISAPFNLGSVPSVFDLEDQIPGLVVRGPASGGFDAGPVTAMNSFGLVNVSRQKVEALDVAFDYQIDTVERGTWTLSAIATRQIHNQTQILTGAPVRELAGTAGGGLDWKANASLNWEYRHLTVNWASTYFDKYWIAADHLVDSNQGSATIPSQLYHDIFARYRFGKVGLFGNVQLQAGVQNVFNTVPPLSVFYNPNAYFDLLGDPRLRRYSLGVSASF